MNEFEARMKSAQSAVGRGKLSRRDFMQFAMTTGLTVVAANTLFATAARAEPKRGGTFRYGSGYGTTIDQLDPATWSNGMDLQYGRSTLHATLFQTDQAGNLVPHLAESYEPSDQFKKWVVKLRKGVTFHNGRDVTSADVVASFLHHVGPDSKSSGKDFLSALESVEADGPLTVIFKLTASNADFPFIFPDYHFAILPATDGKLEWENGIGAGPFILKSFQPGVKMIAERNPNYFKDVWFDQIEMLTIADTTARTNAFVSGEIHFMDKADLRTIQMLESVPNTEIYNVSGKAFYTVPMMVDRAPFDDLNVRLAAKWAIDRQEIVDTVLSGYGKPGNDNMISSNVKYAINPEPVYSYDPDKARSYLKKAGIDRLAVDLHVAPTAVFAGAVDAALLMQDRARAAGIDINVVQEADDAYFAKTWQKVSWMFTYWGGRPTIDLMFTQAVAKDAAWSSTHWANPRFNELLTQARSEADEKVRASMYAECQQLLHDDGGEIVLLFNNYVGSLSTSIGHGEFNSDLDCDGGYMTERWWFA